MDLDSRGAIGLPAFFVNVHNARFELLVLLLALAGLLLAPPPVVVAAGRNLKGLAQMLDGMFGFQGVDPLVALFGGSEMIPKVFFKMSRCWRNSAFSWRKRASSSSRCAWVTAVAGPY